MGETRITEMNREALEESAPPSVRKAAQEAKQREVERLPAEDEKPEVGEDAEWAAHDLAARVLAKELMAQYPRIHDRRGLVAAAEDPAVRSALMRDEEHSIRYFAFKRQDPKSPMFARDAASMIHDPDSERIRVRAVPFLSDPEILAALILDQDQRVRAAAWENPHLPLPFELPYALLGTIDGDAASLERIVNNPTASVPLKAAALANLRSRQESGQPYPHADRTRSPEIVAQEAASLQAVLDRIAAAS